MSSIKYVKGNLFDVVNHSSNVIIPHVCNNVGKWGAGFVLALSKQWPKELRQNSPEYMYTINWKCQQIPLPLCSAQYVRTSDDTVVVNMIAQNGIRHRKNPTPIDYSALEKCMDSIRMRYGNRNYEIHAPKFGSGLAGGDWTVIEKLIEKIWIDGGIPVTIYEL